MSGAWRLAAALAALSNLALSLTQLADLPARQAMESLAWLAATGHGRHYVGTHSLATLVDIGAILALTVNASRERALPRLIWTAAAGLFAASLIAWTLLVLPMIEIMARWTGGSAPSDFALVRDQWETGHGAMAGLKLAGFVALVFGHVRARRTRAMPAGSSPHLRAGLPRGRLCR